MLGNSSLLIDTRCGLHDLVRDQPHQLFWNLKQHCEKNTIKSGSVLLIGHTQMQQNSQLVRELALSQQAMVIYCDPAEGSETLLNHCQAHGIMDLVEQNKISLITGGQVPDCYRHLLWENFLPKILDYEENVTAQRQYHDSYSLDRPWKFLCLNGRYRPHRQQLLSRLSPQLDQALWSNLDSQTGPIRTLPAHYEYSNLVQLNNVPATGFVKNHVFKNKWGDVYIHARAYQHSYFSVVTETVFDYPYSFRTEKIWKPIAVGHPFVAVANQGFYRDLHNLGFQTFASLIDESFDQIENNNDRLNRVVEVVQDLCQQDLASFLESCYNTCKYNQQHLTQLGPQLRKSFPARFANFIESHTHE